MNAIDATENIMNAIHDNGGEFVLQVKKNCPELYTELMRLFEGLSEDREKLDYKRKHWATENCLHYVLDETFGEDKSTIKLG